MIRLRRTIRELLKYPSAIAGLIMILTLLGVAAYAVISMPYAEAIRLWRGDETTWIENPKTAWPVWYDWIVGKNLPQTIVMNSAEGEGTKTVDQRSETTSKILIDFQFDYQYDDFPTEINLDLTTVQNGPKKPSVSVSWLTPDGREIPIERLTPVSHYMVYINSADRLREYFAHFYGNEALAAQVGLFLPPPGEAPAQPTPVKGIYHLVVEGTVFQPGDNVDAKMIMYGQVHGIAGTDNRRRDLTVALLWGTPIALSFGLLAAVGTSISTMIIAAVG